VGYRNYIASIPRKEYNEIKNFTKEELYKYKNEPMDDMGYVGVYKVAHTTLYELGKYVDQFPKKLFKPVFLNKELQKHFTEEHDFYLVGKKFLEVVINDYGLKVKNYYDEMLKDFLTDEKYPKLKDPREVPIESMVKILKHIESMAFEWGCSPFSDSMPYDLKRGDAVTTSWKYEYAQFELVRIYKTFDWKNNVLIYYGY
jgi:hypothetical protein